MTPDSKVLIADMVMPKRVYEADLPAAAMDNCLMVMGGKERTAKGLQEILRRGWVEHGKDLAEQGRVERRGILSRLCYLKIWRRGDRPLQLVGFVGVGTTSTNRAP